MREFSGIMKAAMDERTSRGVSFLCLSSFSFRFRFRMRERVRKSDFSSYHFVIIEASISSAGSNGSPFKLSILSE